MIESFERLVAHYDRFKEKQGQLEKNDVLEQAQVLLDKLKMAGGFIVDPVERNILKSLARDLGETIYHDLDFYPSVRLKLPGEGIETNPFIYGRPVIGDEFINREAELRTIFNRLRNGESTAISGEPHIGKTSLLLKLAERTTQEAYLGNEAQRLIVNLMDMHPISDDYTPASFWEEALEPLVTDSNSIALRPNVEVNYPRNSLEQIFNDLGKTKRSLILLLDEFERLLSHPNFQAPAFFGLLRSLTSRTGGLALVTASRYSVAEMNETGRNLLSVGSPFFNIMIDMRLRPFGEKTVNRLLESFGNLFSLNERHFIHLIAGGNPFLLQAMAAVLMEITGHDRHVRAAELFYERIAFHFDDLWQILDDRIRTAAVILGLKELAGCALGQEFAYKDIEYIDAFGFALRKLVEQGLVERIEESDQVSGKRFFFWRGERWRIGMQAFIWWVRDVVLVKSRRVVTYDEWLARLGYQDLLTHKQWEQLLSVVRDVIDWNACDIKILANNLFRELS